ncbi:MAG: tetratricopeptide repeat-containing glycosyltransferase family protein [Desulfuromonadaceae bacterium]|nr:tetratricopeptide repeat-containing glycosyltransferase family protein [Desulfuromonadaceae bacterium]MDD5104204.1 tetratricopeptide repeat-containing glycosyltransferase family protein [Desulfuromonadaceae bacterium]
MSPASKYLSETAGTIHEVGLCLLQVGRFREAALTFRKALMLQPNLVDAYLCLGHCLHSQEKFDEAVAVYNQLLLTSPGLVTALGNCGNSLLALCRYDEAAQCFTSALRKVPELHDIRVALATCFQALGRLEEAMAACNRVLSDDPKHAEAHWNRALLLLLKGNYEEGWREYEWRWQKRGFTSPRRDFAQPLWRGESLAGKTILIHAEQGFGDTIQFSRFVPMVADLGAMVIFECHPPLASLLKSLDERVTIVAQGERLPCFDIHLPLLSLPMIFNTTLTTIPVNIPYLKNSAAEKFCHFFGKGAFKVGICWSGKLYPDPGRSCPAELLKPLAELDGIVWYSLQIQNTTELPFPMTDLTPYINDFSDTAALLHNLDLIITIDTALAHLAGAMGKPAWVMLPYAPDWRWLLDRSDSPWYPSIRLFRQEKTGDWQGVIEAVSGALSKMLS